MKIYGIGIDSGSTMCKAALFDGKSVLALVSIPTGWNPKESARYCYEKLMQDYQLDEKNVITVSTGYGREQIDFAKKSVTEISCHALGGMYLDVQADGIIDIGGQDSKMIKLKDGKVTSFYMNDKCAAGTGRFLEMACLRLGIQFHEIDGFVISDESVTINSMCAVFAESEIIGLLAGGVSRSKIVLGILHSIAEKVDQMMSRAGCDDCSHFLMTGGLASSRRLVEEIEKVTGKKIVPHKNSQYAGAIGAGIFAMRE